MSKSYILPPDCTLRPARSTDKVAIYILHLGLARWAIPATSNAQLIQQEIAMILVEPTAIIFLIFVLPQRIFAIVDGNGSLYANETLVLVYCSTLWLLMTLQFWATYKACFQKNWSGFCVVENSGRLVAYVTLYDSAQFTIVKCLFVTRNYRRKGVGSYVVQNLIQRATKPIYVRSALGKARFYTRLGFVKVRLKQLPPTIRRKLKGAGIGEPLLMSDRNQQ